MFMKSVMIKTKILTKQVQSVNINIVDTLESAKVTISTLRHLRDDEQNLNNLITAAVEFSECHGVDANGEYQRQHRHRRPTRRVDSSMFCRCGTGGCVPSGMCTLGDVYPRGCVPSEPYRK